MLVFAMIKGMENRKTIAMTTTTEMSIMMMVIMEKMQIEIVKNEKENIKKQLL